MTTAALTPETTITLATQPDDTAQIPRVEQPGQVGQPGQPGANGPAASFATGASNGPGQPAQFAQPVQPVAEESRGFAITSFVLGIASVVSGWTLIAPITGLIFGIIALRRRTSDRTLALWGVWLNGVMLAFTALMALVVLALVAFGLFTVPFLG